MGVCGCFKRVLVSPHLGQGKAVMAEGWAVVAEG